MESHRNLTDEAFVAAFAACSLPEALFNHEAHLRLAWIHIRNQGLEQATATVCTQITNYVKHLGAEDIYNEPLTVAAVHIVHQFQEQATELDFLPFMERFPQLKTNFRELINAYLSES
ncbi:MAG: hypothetical protein R3B47_19090 [Bacteroidia bacterium]